MKNLYRQEISLNEITEIIYHAWQDCQKYIDISQDLYNKRELKPEYLVTVKISDRIIKQAIETPMSNFALKLEEKTKDVFERCFIDLERIDHPNKRKIIFKKRQTNESKERKGKFDITVYKKDNFYKLDSYRTYFVIEIKNFESSYNKIELDLIRIKELMFREDMAANNSCQYGILTYSKKVNKKKTIDALFNNKLNEIIENEKSQIFKKLKIDEEDKNIIITVKELHDKIEDEEYKLSYMFLIIIITVKLNNCNS